MRKFFIRLGFVLTIALVLPLVTVVAESPSHPVRQAFQLHANGWHFEQGHVARLELLPNDATYGRASNGQQDVRVHNLELRLPVVEQPGSLGGLVKTPEAEYVPAGYTLAPGF